MLAIIDYGMGNLHSVYNALQFMGCSCIITNNPQDLKDCKGMILPGVGAFKDCMDNLVASELVPTILEEVKKGKPLLGICVGMQVLYEVGYEVEKTKGLGLLQGCIALMKNDTLKIPHMGWNRLIKNKDVSLLKGCSQEPYVYYVHSYYAGDYVEEEVLAYSMYGDIKICGMVQKENVYGVQFHPEKSGEEGLQILKNFMEVCSC